MKKKFNNGTIKRNIGLMDLKKHRAIKERKCMASKNKQTYTVEEIVTILKKEADNETIEGQLLKPKLIRELYKQLGKPKEEDFGKEMYPAGTYYEKWQGYTRNLLLRTEKEMKASNNAPTNWRIARPSKIKKDLEEKYTRAGWSVDVQAFNVICDKYVKHPRYKNLWIRLYSSRDCNKYEYVIEKE